MAENWLNEEFEKLNCMKCKLISCLCEQVENGLEHIDAKEFGEVIDVVKDIYEMQYYYSEVYKNMKSDEFSDEEIDEQMRMMSEPKHTVSTSLGGIKE